ncbi:energy transducer TonB [Terriglobus aquaticus]|uniref:Energy transducer TonB n=2 Tax=Terriglobus aquaticus TaxID=940139 RepID=A0ABW9KN96_9BACT
MILSLAAHLSAAALLLVTIQHAPSIAPYKLPGTASGLHLLTYYSPGSAADQRAQTTRPVEAKKPNVTKPRPPIPTTKPSTDQTSAEKGTGSSQLSGLGQGDISIALVRFYPSPQPDLSTLSPGQQGDVVLEAVIDEAGKISKLTLMEGLTPAIDQEVLAKVQTWTFQPAKRNGTPVQSAQELHFHYERARG